MRSKKTYIISLIILLTVFITENSLLKLENNFQKFVNKNDDSSFIDDSGNLISVNKKINRIVSLEPAHTYNLYELGQFNKIIARDKNSLYPVEINQIPITTFEYKEIQKLLPDVVLITPQIVDEYGDLVKSLKRNGIKVVSLWPKRIDELDSYFNKLGIILNVQEKANDVYKDIEVSLKKINESKKTVSIEINGIKKTLSKDAFESDLISLVGGEFSTNPDIYLTKRGNSVNGGSELSISNRTAIASKVYEVNTNLISPTKLINLGLFELNRIINGYDFNLMEYDSEFMTRVDFSKLLILASNKQLYIPSSKDFELTNLFKIKDISYDSDVFWILTAIKYGLLDTTYLDGEFFFYPDDYVTYQDFTKAYNILFGTFFHSNNDFEYIETSEILENLSKWSEDIDKD